MKCPLETGSAEKLLAYGARKLDAESAVLLEQHIASCPACGELARGQRQVWEALEAWEPRPVSADFNRRLYLRIEQRASWRGLLARPFRPFLAHHGLPVAAAACLMIVAGFLLDRPAAPPEPGPASAQVESLRPEQVERVVDDMDMLTRFSLVARSDANPQM